MKYRPQLFQFRCFFLKNPTKNATEKGRKRKTTKNLTSTIKCIFIFILGYFCIEDVWKHVFTLQTDEDCIAHNIHKRQFLCIFFLPFVHTDKHTHTPTHMVLLNLFQITLDRFVHMHRMYKILWNNLHAYSVFIWKYDRSTHVYVCVCSRKAWGKTNKKKSYANALGHAITLIQLSNRYVCRRWCWCCVLVFVFTNAGRNVHTSCAPELFIYAIILRKRKMVDFSFFIKRNLINLVWTCLLHINTYTYMHIHFLAQVNK